MAATAIRATALPMPEVTVTDEVRGYGTVAKGVTGKVVRVGETELLLGGSGRVYDVCGRCSGRGFMAEYAGIYAGECFECRYAGVKLYAADTGEAARKVRKAQAAAARAAAKWEAEAPAREAAAIAAAAAELEAAHAAALEEAARREALEARRWIGTEGGKVTVSGTVTRAFSVWSRFGSSMLVVIEGTGDDAGVTLKTFGTSDWHYDREEGEAVRITATVKAHELYDGVRETVVKSPKAAK